MTKTHHITRSSSIHYAALLVSNNCSGGGGTKDDSVSRLLILHSDWRSWFRDHEGIMKSVNSYETSLPLVGGLSGHETSPGAHVISFRTWHSWFIICGDLTSTLHVASPRKGARAWLWPIVQDIGCHFLFLHLWEKVTTLALQSQLIYSCYQGLNSPFVPCHPEFLSPWAY